MPFENQRITERVHRLLPQINELARRLGHDEILPGHILHALMCLGEGTAWEVLKGFNVNGAMILSTIEREMPEGGDYPSIKSIPFSLEAEKVFAGAAVAARELTDIYLGTEHILIGLVNYEEGFPAILLRDVGATAEKVRKATVQLLGKEPLSTPPSLEWIGTDWPINNEPWGISKAEMQVIANGCKSQADARERIAKWESWRKRAWELTHNPDKLIGELRPLIETLKALANDEGNRFEHATGLLQKFVGDLNSISKWRFPAEAGDYLAHQLIQLFAIRRPIPGPFRGLALVREIARHGNSPEVLQFLKEVLEDPDPAYRQAVIEAIGRRQFEKVHNLPRESA